MAEMIGELRFAGSGLPGKQQRLPKQQGHIDRSDQVVVRDVTGGVGRPLELENGQLHRGLSGWPGSVIVWKAEKHNLDPVALQQSLQDTRERFRSEERRVGKSVDLGGRRIITKK